MDDLQSTNYNLVLTPVNFLVYIVVKLGINYNPRIY